jgi:hypothetical protein
MTSQPGILTTGSNRSGTTWVGEMLCHSGQLHRVHEPFNPGLWPRWTARPLPYRNLYVCAENETDYLEAIRGVLRCRLPVRAQVGEVRSVRQAARLGRDSLRSLSCQLRPRPTLVKDPIAVFSAPWLAERFGLRVVVTIRNPAAFTSSIVRLGWRFDFRNWLDQELLMRDLLGPFEREIVAMVERPHDLVDQSILLWRAHYAVIDRFRADHPDWHFVRWEDLALAPVEGFRSLYEALGLRFDDVVATRIERDNGDLQAVDVAPGEKGTTRRDSVATVDAWRRRISPDDHARVRDGVADVAARFYTADEWSLVAPR